MEIQKISVQQNLVDGNKDSYWATNDATTTGQVEFQLQEVKPIGFVVLQEYVRLGQRVKSFRVEVWKDNAWQKVAKERRLGTNVF